MTNYTIVNGLDAKQVVKLMLNTSDVKTHKELAGKLGVAKNTFQSSLDNNSLRLRDLQKVAEILGYKIIITTNSSDFK